MREIITKQVVNPIEVEATENIDHPTFEKNWIEGVKPKNVRVSECAKIINENIEFLKGVVDQIKKTSGFSDEDKKYVNKQLSRYIKASQDPSFQKYKENGGVLLHGDTDASKAAGLCALLLSGRASLDNNSTNRESVAKLFLNSQNAWREGVHMLNEKTRVSSLDRANACWGAIFKEIKTFKPEKHQFIMLGDMSRDRLSLKVRENDQVSGPISDHGFMKFMAKLGTIISGNHDTQSGLALMGGVQVGNPGLYNVNSGKTIHRRMSFISASDAKNPDTLNSGIKKDLNLSSVEKTRDGSFYISHTGACMNSMGDIYVGASFSPAVKPGTSNIFTLEESKNNAELLKAKLNKLEDGINNILLNPLPEGVKLLKLGKATHETFETPIVINKAAIDAMKKNHNFEDESKIDILDAINNFLIKQPGIEVGTGFSRCRSDGSTPYTEENIKNFNREFGVKQIHGHDDESFDGFHSINRGAGESSDHYQAFNVHVIPADRESFSVNSSFNKGTSRSHTSNARTESSVKTKSIASTEPISHSRTVTQPMVGVPEAKNIPKAKTEGKTEAKTGPQHQPSTSNKNASLTAESPVKETTKINAGSPEVKNVGSKTLKYVRPINTQEQKLPPSTTWTKLRSSFSDAVRTVVYFFRDIKQRIFG